jgi:hypothetical protein
MGEMQKNVWKNILTAVVGFLGALIGAIFGA